MSTAPEPKPIKFTVEERDFALGILEKQQINLAHPGAVEIAKLGRSLIEKLRLLTDEPPAKDA